MSQALQLVALGVVQGLTEFIPVSSTAHLVFAEYLLGVRRPGVVLEGVLHLGTVVALVVLFWRDLVKLSRGLLRSLRGEHPNPYGRMAWMIVVVTAITAVVGVGLDQTLERMFNSVRDTALQLIANGAIVLLAFPRAARTSEQVTIADATAVGLAQALSIVPGISRSGATIAAGVWRGLSREEAARFSFLAAVPAILGAGLYTLKDAARAGSLGYGPVELAIGFVTSALSGIIAIRWLISVIRRGQLRWFAYYCFAAGALMLVVLWRGG